jgi:hypothetical protein
VIFAVFTAAESFSIHVASIESARVAPGMMLKLVGSWCASVCALFLNPYGWRLVLYPFDLAFRQQLNVANVEEWQSLDFHSPRGRLLLVCLVLLFMLQLTRSRRWKPYELAFSLIGIYSAFNYSRFLFLAAILITPSVANSLARRSFGEVLPVRRRALSPLLQAALLFLVLCFIGGRIRTQLKEPLQADARFPDKVVPFLLTKFEPTGRVFNEYLWGGFMEWYTPQIPVFIDSRADIFEYNGTFRDYLNVVRVKDSLKILEKYQIRYVLFERDSPLIYLLKTTRQWKVDYEDETTTLLERKADY